MTHNSQEPMQVNNLFTRIAGVYDFLNHTLSMGIDKIWRKELCALAKPANNGPVLDLAAGTLDVSLALAQICPNKICALDFCLPMLEKGMIKLAKKNLVGRIYPACGDATNLPYKDNFFESVTIAFGIRNIPERVRALKEMYRVLRPGGKVCILEFGNGTTKIWGGLYNWYLNNILPRIGSLMGNDRKAYEYLAETIRNFPLPKQFEDELIEAGFTATSYKKQTGGIVYLHQGKKLTKC